ncbi:oxidoreductase, short chain dehydrogenase/reductase family protein [Dictyocaulus viviparus]|uniref:Oxidoreductase, short chain dehydrogenase/reductase family protein n=1 Tax=Dictyocaulus viviparus TaxID=29172 RepID=A0A0D8XRT4_DICVI|nr:oxidoreductase, short chain dehydrogenase/reductase family protein [Dictyocaulus viviparus]
MMKAELLEVLQRYLKMLVIPVAMYSVYKLCSFLLPGPHHHSKLTYANKTVLITGASSGERPWSCFGVPALQKGAKVIATARSIDKLKELCEDLKRSYSGNPYEPMYSYLDICEPMNVESLKNLAIDGKTIHVLINNAGLSMRGSIQDTSINVYSYLDICEPMNVESLKNLAIDGKTIHVLINNAGLSMRGSIQDTSINVYRQIMDVNFFGHVVVTQKLLDAIPDDGCIIAISSVQGKLSIPYRSAYSASKHAFQAFFDALRCENRPNLHILTVSAGYMNTGFGTRALDVQGRPLGKDDANQLKGLSPETAACEILRAASARETELIMAPLSNKLAIFLRWAWPTLLFYILHGRGLKDDYITSRAR